MEVGALCEGEYLPVGEMWDVTYKSLNGEKAGLAFTPLCIIINRICLKCKENILETVQIV